MNDNNPYAVWIWTTLASFAGALSALSFRLFKEMSRGEIIFSLAVGASFAIFVGPWAATVMFGRDLDMRAMGGLFYLMATGSNVLIPVLVQALKRVFSGGGQVS